MRDQIDKIRRSFFWKVGREITSSVCLVNWDEVCQPKSQGGLGVHSLQTMNDALIGKWICRFLNQSELLWCQLVNHMHYKESSFLQEKS